MATYGCAASLAMLVLVTLCHAAPENCLFMCPMVYAPVCASNGVTYSNSCMMKGAACRSGQTLEIVKAGPCVGTGSRLDLTVSKRQCPQACADIYKPVCGSDGKTYANECELKVAACTTGSALKVVGSGECPDGALVTDAPKTPSDCNVMCTMHYDPVCASDGQTYGNECTMNSAACEMGKVLKIVSRGECPDEVSAAPANEKQCLGICPMIYLPVCGTDDRTYGNECEMKHEACTSGKNIQVAHPGTCEEKSTKCEMACFALYAPVCASDGQTYSNECVMRVAACQKGDTLKVVSQGECPVVSDVCKINPCPKHYNPVCGSDKKIYGNDCMLANAQCEHKLRGEKLDELPLVSCLLGGN